MKLWGLNDPLHVQYFSFVGRALQFDFGISYRTAQPVCGHDSQRLPATLELALVRRFLHRFGCRAGVYTAINRGLLRNSILSSSLIGVSLPDLPDRRSADLGVLGRAEVAPVLWAR